MGQRIPIDNAGRIVVPKSVRERLGLRAGTVLLLEVEGEQMILKPDSGRKNGLEKRDGILVLNGELYGPVKTVTDVYQESLRVKSSSLA